MRWHGWMGGHLESNFGIVWPKCLQGMAGATSGDLGCVENKCSAKEFCHHAGKWWELTGKFSTHCISFALIYSLIALNVNNSTIPVGLTGLPDPALEGRNQGVDCLGTCQGTLGWIQVHSGWLKSPVLHSYTVEITVPCWLASGGHQQLLEAPLQFLYVPLFILEPHPILSYL